MGASSQPSFCLLTQGPPEILHEILSYCQQNDLVCLSLTSHLFRGLTRSLIPAKPSLVSCDESLTDQPRLAACGQPIGDVAYHPYMHRRRRHRCFLHSRETCAEPWYCPRYPPGHRICHRKWCSHCECITCPLYKRLREWAGDLKYCTICSKFTKRETTNKYKGRCEFLDFASRHLQPWLIPSIQASTVVPKPARLPIITGQRKRASHTATAGGGDGGLLAWTLGLTVRSQGLPVK